MKRLPLVHLAGNCAVDVIIQNGSADGASRSIGNLQITDDAPETFLAGNAAWPAYLLGKMGHTVQLNTRIGHDLFGRYLRERLATAQVSLVGSDANHSSVSIFPAAEGGVQTGSIYPGESIDWLASQTALDQEAGFEWFFAAGYTGISPNDAVEMKHLFAELACRNVQIVFDPGPWFARRVGTKSLLDLFAYTHCLSATETELAQWFGKAEPAKMAQHAFDLGARIVIIKQGCDGATFASSDGNSAFVATSPVSGAVAIGAGDTFNAGLLHGLSTGMTLHATVTLAVSMATELVRVGRGAFRLPDTF